MTARKTPFERIRYPWGSDVVTASSVQAMASDIDQSLVQTGVLVNNFTKSASIAVRRGAAQSITKGTVTAISWDTVQLNNGADSPLLNGSWYSSSNPTRITAPTSCLVIANGYAGLNFTTALGTSGCLQVFVALNGATGNPNVQGQKYQPGSTDTGQIWTSVMSMWHLNAGDYLELKVYWTGTPAGPFSTDTSWAPYMSVMMVGVPVVA